MAQARCATEMRYRDALPSCATEMRFSLQWSCTIRQKEKPVKSVAGNVAGVASQCVSF